MYVVSYLNRQGHPQAVVIRGVRNNDVFKFFEEARCKVIEILPVYPPEVLSITELKAALE